MVNGRIAQEMPARELAADRELQERLLGVRSGGARRGAAPPAPAAGATPTARRRRRCSPCGARMREGAPTLDDLAPRTVRGFKRWNAGGTAAPVADIARDGAALARAAARRRERADAPASSRSPAQVFDFPVAASSGRAAYVAGTFDTKGRELFFLRQCLEKLGLRVVTVDLATSGKPSPASVHPREVARHHPAGRSGRVQRRPRQRGHRDGARLRALHRARGATSAASSRPAARAAPRWRRRRCARCRSACPR